MSDASTRTISPPALVLDTGSCLPALASMQQHIVGSLVDLDDATLRRPVLPSGWSCAGMIHHLTGMTRFWFEEVMLGRSLPSGSSDDFAVDPAVPVSAVIAEYVRATQDGHAAVRDLPLDARPAWWPDGRFGPWRLHTLFEVLLHVLVESSTHAGHLDAARELIDGRTWDHTSQRLGQPRSA